MEGKDKPVKGKKTETTEKKEGAEKKPVEKKEAAPAPAKETAHKDTAPKKGGKDEKKETPAAKPAAPKTAEGTKKPKEHHEKKTNPMRKLRIEKLVLNCCVGTSGDRLTRAAKVLEQLTGQTPVSSKARYTVRTFNIRRNEKNFCSLYGTWR